MRRRRRERPDAQLGRWVCDGLVPMPLPTRLAREVARTANFDALHAALARIEHAFIECRIDHDQVAALRQQHRRRFYALADEAIVTRQKHQDPREAGLLELTGGTEQLAYRNSTGDPRARCHRDESALPREKLLDNP